MNESPLSAAPKKGQTTQQMELAPKAAVFVWVSGDLHYPKKLALAIGRADLQIEAPDWLEHRARAQRPSGLVVDHAARLTAEQHAGFRRLRERRVHSYDTGPQRQPMGTRQ